MRPIYHRKADRLRTKADRFEKEGPARLQALKARDPKEYELYRKTFAHVIAGLGGENDADTAQRIAAHEARHGALTDEQIIAAWRDLARLEGVFCEPASAAGVAGLRMLVQDGRAVTMPSSR